MKDFEPELWQFLLLLQAGEGKECAQPCQNKLENTDEWQTGHEPEIFLCNPEGQPYPGLH